MESSFRLEHHRRISKILDALDGKLLRDTKVYFAGGTAMTLLAGEYRLSNAIDLIVRYEDGFLGVRSWVASDSLGPLFKGHRSLKLTREVRADRYAVRTAIEMDGVSVKFEIFNDNRTELSPGEMIGDITCLSDHCLLVQKLLAMADRGQDAVYQSRDTIDFLAFASARKLGPHIPHALEAAVRAYRGLALQAYQREMSIPNDLLIKRMKAFDIAPSTQDAILGMKADLQMRLLAASESMDPK